MSFLNDLEVEFCAVCCSQHGTLRPCPGLVETQMLNGMLAQRAADTGTTVEELKDGLKQMVPLGRLDEPEEIAAMAVFLAGPGARNITGQTINIDGGLVMN